MTYLDNSATTQPEKAVAHKVYEMLTECYGNPSSFHKIGLNANMEVRTARQKIADALSAKIGCLIQKFFTREPTPVARHFPDRDLMPPTRPASPAGESARGRKRRAT